MSLPDFVLELLRDESAPLSGEEMARILNVSRSAVWKAVKKLRSSGCEIEAGTNRGYRLISEGEILSPAAVRKRLTGPARSASVEVVEQIPSTNNAVKELAEKGVPEGKVMIAEQQTAGKGRLGREFYSPKGSGLYMSILLRPVLSADDCLFITTAAAVAAAEAIESISGRPAMIKWVNDVYVNGYKVCGILTEASFDFELGKLNYAVLGIGVNICQPEGGFSGPLRGIAGAVFEEDVPHGSRAALAAEILNRFFVLYEQLPDRSFIAEYEKRFLLTGVRVDYLRGGERCSGVVLGTDRDARLVVQLDDGSVSSFSTGEVEIEKSFLERLRGKETAG